MGGETLHQTGSESGLLETLDMNSTRLECRPPSICAACFAAAFAAGLVM